MRGRIMIGHEAAKQAKVQLNEIEGQYFKAARSQEERVTKERGDMAINAGEKVKNILKVSRGNEATHMSVGTHLQLARRHATRVFPLTQMSLLFSP
jgi:hypothetical protein